MACYYTPFVFMFGNAVAQSAQPIVSFNYGAGKMDRVLSVSRLSIITAVICGFALSGWPYSCSCPAPS